MLARGYHPFVLFSQKVGSPALWREQVIRDVLMHLDGNADPMIEDALLGPFDHGEM